MAPPGVCDGEEASDSTSGQGELEGGVQTADPPHPPGDVAGRGRTSGRDLLPYLLPLGEIPGICGKRWHMQGRLFFNFSYYM